MAFSIENGQLREAIQRASQSDLAKSKWIQDLNKALSGFEGPISHGKGHEMGGTAGGINKEGRQIGGSATVGQKLK